MYSHLDVSPPRVVSSTVPNGIHGIYDVNNFHHWTLILRVVNLVEV